MKEKIKKIIVMIFLGIGALYFTFGILYSHFLTDKIYNREAYLISVADSLGNIDGAVEIRNKMLKKLFKRSFIRYYKNTKSMKEIIDNYEKKLKDNGYDISYKDGIQGEKNNVIVIINKTKSGFYILVKFDDIFNKLNL